MILGYMVPEFPGQTHIMFEREIAVLRRRGVVVDVVSTRRPVGPVRDSFAELTRATTYLMPFRPSLVAAAVAAVARAGPRRWAAWAGAVRSAEVDGGIRGRARLLALALCGAALAGVARRRRWGHLHVHSCADSAHIAMFASCLSGVRYSLTLHGPLGDYGADQRGKWRRASFAVVITETLRREVEDQLAGALPASVRVAGMGVDAAALARSGPYRPWHPGQRATLFSCGRLNRSKGHVDVVTAVAALRAEGLDVELVIAGEDEQGGSGYRRTLEAHVERLGVGDAVELLGSVPESEIRKRLDAAHLFVLASMAEPLGVAIMEAMAMEVPVVVTSAGGVSELVTDGEDGLLVPPGSPGAIVAAVRRVLDDPDLAVALGRRARVTVAERFGVERNAGVLVEEIGRLEPP